MATKLTTPKSPSSLGIRLIAAYAKQSNDLEITWGKDLVLDLKGHMVKCASSIARYFARTCALPHFYGSSILERTEVDHWISFAHNQQVDEGFLKLLDAALKFGTFVVGHSITAADLALWGALQGSTEKIEESFTNVKRWNEYVKSLPVVQKAMVEVSKEVKMEKKSSASSKSADSGKTGTRTKDEGKFIDLPGAKDGEVVVRFPPEASGYLHIGHAKAALLNQFYQQKFNGTLIMRFDDTNPAKENAEFEKVILEDLEMLQVKYDKLTHTSDHFDLLEKYCEQMLQEGHAYVDDTEPEAMKEERDQKVESKNRTNSVEKNMSMWEEMKKGTEYGQKCCVRAKIDMQSVNGCMRDPTMYRCKPEPHVRTGYKYKVYPTYDFACPIVDSVEGVTHALRTTEYHDRDEQYYWFLDTLKMRKPFIWEYARLNMQNTVLSKRKLTWFVQEGYVDGWDDPRFPTVRGVLRQGMTVEGLKQFIIAQGSSRSVVQMEWDKIWAFNKKIIDPVVPRYTAVERDAVAEVRIRGVEEKVSSAALHPKNEAVGTKQIWLSGVALIDAADVDSLRTGENATFINWGNIRISKVTKSDNKIVVDAEPNIEDKDYKKTPKLTWLPVSQKAKLIPCVCVYFDHIISKPVLAKDEDFKTYINPNTKREVCMLGEPELEKLKKGDIIQLQRKGYFICDSPYQPISRYSSVEAPLILFYIPDGTKPAEQAKTETTASATAKAATAKKEETKPSKELPSAPAQSDPSGLNEQIKTIGNRVRELKGAKADKSVVDAAVKELLSLKAAFKASTGLDWSPTVVIPTAESNSGLSEQITTVGNKIRELKSAKADKSVIDAAVKELLALKAAFKASTGLDWSPTVIIPTPESKSDTKTMSNLQELDGKVRDCGDRVRNLKAQKAEKALIDASVKELLELKKKFKEEAGFEWGPDASQKLAANSSSSISDATAASEVAALHAQVTECGNKVRTLKANKADKAIVDAAVKELLEMKQKYKSVTGAEYNVNQPATAGSSASAKSSGNANAPPAAAAKEGKKEDKKAKKQCGAPKPAGKVPEEDGAQGALKKQTRLGLEIKKDENLADWYSQIITKSEMIEYYDVSGCYILRPWAYSIWESIKDFFDAEIKKLGVQNCYFPMFVSHHALEKEKTHIADFAPEVAWVTKSGDSELAEPIAIRPTSETVMYPSYAKWIQSHRDLPLKLNQWNNVVRWEFKHPQPFLRTREFLWQEGHTAFATYEEAEKEVYQILDLYRQVYTDLLAIPVIKGKKTEKEKFAGGDFTTTVEAFIAASGRGIQGATSHHLGQNFSKMFEIVVEDPETKEKKFIYQNSWGLTTRTIGVMVMVHADDKGLVLPPNVACIQVVIVPCGINVNITEEEKDLLIKTCEEYEQLLSANSIRVKGDYRDNYSPGWKFNHWELKGVPIRIEIGPRDVKKGEYVAVRRDTGEKLVQKKESMVADVKNLLTGIHQDLLNKATQELKDHTVVVHDFKDFIPELDKKNIILAPFCGEGSCEEKIKKESTRDDGGEPGAPAMGAKSLCIPFDQPAEIGASTKCIHPACTRKPQYYCLFGRSY